jgi:hypothetical protein
MKKKQPKTDEVRFEVQLSDGRIRKFSSGEDLYNWTRIVRNKWQYELKESKNETVDPE